LSKKIKQAALDRSTAEYKDTFAKVDTALTNLYGKPVGLGGDDAAKQMELYKKNLENFKESQKQEIQNLYDLLAGNKKPEDFGGQGWNSERFKGLMQQLQNLKIIKGDVAKGWDLSGLRDYINGMRVVKKLEEEMATLEPSTIVVDDNVDKINTNVISLDSLKKKRDELIKQSNEVSVSNTELAAKYRNEAAEVDKLIAEHERLIAVRQRELQGIDTSPIELIKPLYVSEVKLPDAKLAKPLTIDAQVRIKTDNLDTLKEKIKEYQDMLSSGVNWSDSELGYINRMIGEYQAAIDKISDTDAFGKTLEGVNQMSDAFSKMGAAIDSSAGSMLQWAAQMLQSIAQTIPQIMMLTGAISAETAVNWGLAASEAAVQNAKNGPYGWIMAAAAVASLIALAASVPKFADGGIAYGPTLGLFGEYSGAANNPEVVAPLSKLRDLIEPAGSFGEVRFEIEGRTLVGVLNKVNRFNSRTK
jgi:hypothetical protein